ncbi:MAG: ATP-binding protein [Acutalibacteraceae bacterium]|nr:ATP-binding protein [Acutalibacteraceae bacterium]
MTKKIFRSILVVATAVLLISLSVVTLVLYDHFENFTTAQLKSELSLAVKGVELSGKDYLENLSDDNFRITWVDENGEVLFDSKADAISMYNHIDREEISEAIDSGYGESARYSETLTQKMLYSAYRLTDGTVLRVATSVDSVFTLLLNALVPMIIIFACAVIISVLVARRMAKGIVKPLNKLDLEHPTENDTYEELSPILYKISKQHKEIGKQVKLLRQKTDEFEQIISSMNEGLILLDVHGMVLSMNQAAKRIFSVTDSKTNCDFLTIDRSIEMSKAVNDALNGKHSEFRAQKNGNEYQFDISRIESGGKTLGAVILGFDITDKAFAERNRQEFTANVSHELKTPLQSIIGSAELLENGLVKPEDTARFIGNIKNEATRLVSLINDIIRLSQLDENNAPLAEEFDVADVAKEVADTLSSVAVKKNVTLEIKGECCMISGVRRYIYEIIYNLCDNAIRYNVDGGKVTVDIRKENGSTVICVDDTGIGIVPEHHARIFERFYRVDKSHSKETGGTGLGLSIVKHAVQYHGGKIEFQSEVGKGTKIRVII